MKKMLSLLFAVVICLGMITTAGVAQESGAAQNATGPQRQQDRITREVRHELVMLPQLTIFDNLQYKVDGGKVTLMGEVRNAVLKDEAQNAVKHIEGVEQVDNRIDILPPSSTDDHIRLAVAHALFGQDSPLFRYSMGALPPIHIIVKNGHVTLEGVVNSQADKDLASLKANSVPGVFSVDNHLVVQKS
ncbi:MAG TPA: BON domain-containing protein [Candidatus Angelobacter sp.]|jgi:hyperosmotically inducible protein